VKKPDFIKKAVIATAISTCIGYLPANAQTISLDSQVQYVRVGTTFDLSLLISNLTASGVPSLGAYDFLLLFDSNLVSLLGNSLGPALSANPANSLFGTDATMLGQLGIFEVSLESAANLNSAQSNTLPLGSLTFLAQNVGAANFSLSGLAFADADGNALSPILNGVTVMLVDRTSVDEFAQPLSGTLMANIAFADLTQSCDHRFIKKLSGNSGNKACLFVGGSYADSKFNTIAVNENSTSYFGGGLVQLKGGLMLGGGISAGSFNTNYMNTSSIDDGDRFSFNGVVGWNFDPFVVTGSYTRTNSDGALWITHANLGGMVSRTPFNVTSTSVMLRASYETQMNGITVIPSASVAAVKTEIDDLKETGADVLTVFAQQSSDNSTVVHIKVDFSKTHSGSGSAKVRPHLGLGWQSTSSDEFQINALFADNLAATVPDIRAQFDLIDSDMFTIEPGISIGIRQDTSINFGYKGLFGSNTTQHIGSATLRIVF